MSAEPESKLVELKKEARQAPLEPGCYIMRNGEGKIVYVGKAKVLRHRLSSYFSGKKDIKTSTLMRNVRSIETIIVSNEYEALLLENTLIKQHSPKYNIDLKDGKTYPVIRITREKFPKIFKTRYIVEDGSLYFGPFTNVNRIDTLIDIIKKTYPVRKCKTMQKRLHPCIYYHIGQCAAPCCGKISEQSYAKHIKVISDFLKGNTSGFVISLTKSMHKAAANLLFEKAAQYRDALKAVDEIQSENSVVDFDKDSRDYIAFSGEGLLYTWTVFSMRAGLLSGRDLYRTKSAAPEPESLETFITIFYSPEKPPPEKIYFQKTNGDFNPLNAEQFFKDKFGFSPSFEAPNEKRHLAVLALARQNASEDLRKRLKERGSAPVIDELQKNLGLKRRPRRIEGFDIAQLDGKHPVASLVSFYNGAPDKKNYRVFKLKTVINKVDDFAALREAVRRRYSRLLREEKELPDFILIDGGIGQVNAARSALLELGIDREIAGLAKRDEEIWLPAESAVKSPLCLSKDSPALKLLQAVRDETHRFATRLNQKLRSKDIALRSLESIEGIGAVRAQKLIQKFESVKNILAAEAGDVARAAGISASLAKIVIAAMKIEAENLEAAYSSST